jgi:Chalcone isomerase-like
MKIIRCFLILALLSVSISLGNAREPLELPAHLSSAKLQGNGRLTWWGLHIYDAFFYRVGSLTSPEFALELRYQKAFSGKSIANRSVEEMRRSGISEDQAAVWGKELTAFLPNVDSGHTLTAIYSPKQGTIFYHDSKQIGQIPGFEFSKAFFGIWLDPKTSAPKLRTELLGQTCPPPLFNEAC